RRLALREELQKTARREGSGARDGPDYGPPACADFHRVTTAASHELEVVRTGDYLVDSGYRRTLRPYSVPRLQSLQQAVRNLQHVHFPRGKLHALFEAALEPQPHRAERLVREIFSRCNQEHRRALWQAVKELGPAGRSFPWYGNNGKVRTVIADLAEAFDLFEEVAP